MCTNKQKHILKYMQDKLGIRASDAHMLSCRRTGMGISLSPLLSLKFSLGPPTSCLTPAHPPFLPPARGLTAGAKNERVEGEREEGGPE